MFSHCPSFKGTISSRALGKVSDWNLGVANTVTIAEMTNIKNIKALDRKGRAGNLIKNLVGTSFIPGNGYSAEC